MILYVFLWICLFPPRRPRGEHDAEDIVQPEDGVDECPGARGWGEEAQTATTPGQQQQGKQIHRQIFTNI